MRSPRFSFVQTVTNLWFNMQCATDAAEIISHFHENRGLWSDLSLVSIKVQMKAENRRGLLWRVSAYIRMSLEVSEIWRCHWKLCMVFSIVWKQPISWLPPSPLYFSLQCNLSFAIPHIYFRTRLCIVFLLKNWFFFSFLTCLAKPFFSPHVIFGEPYSLVPEAISDYLLFKGGWKTRTEHWLERLKCVWALAALCVSTQAWAREWVCGYLMGLLLMFLKQLRGVSKNHITKGS